MNVYIPESNKIIHKTSVDFIMRQINRPIHLVQGDRSMPILEVALYKNGQSYIIPDNAEISIRLSKSDNTFSYNKALGCNTEKTSVYFEITEQMTVLSETIRSVIEVVIDNSVAASSNVIFEVDRNPIQDGMIESTYEYIDLKEKVQEAKEYADNAKTSEDKAKEYLVASESSASDALQYKNDAESAARHIDDISDHVEETATYIDEQISKAEEEARKASESAVYAKTSEINAKSSEVNAKSSYDMMVEHYADIVKEVEDVKAIAEGQNKAMVFDTEEDAISWLSDPDNKNILKVGNNIYIKAEKTPDLWVSKVLDTPSSEGMYYEVTELEVGKVNLDEIEQKLIELDTKTTSLGKVVDDGFSDVNKSATFQNEIPYPYSRESGYVNNGIEWTYDDNGTIRAVGTSDFASFDIYNTELGSDRMNLVDGETYTLSLITSDLSNCVLYLTNGYRGLALLNDGEASVTFTYSSGSMTKLLLDIKPGYTVDQYFKIMLSKGNNHHNYQNPAESNANLREAIRHIDPDLPTNLVTFKEGETVELEGLARQLYETDVVDSLDSSLTNRPLSANMGREIQKYIDILNATVSLLSSNLSNIFKYKDYSKTDSYIANERAFVANLDTDGIKGFIPISAIRISSNNDKDTNPIIMNVIRNDVASTNLYIMNLTNNSLSSRTDTIRVFFINKSYITVDGFNIA